MLRCMELGKKGLGTTAPNPMVGCVVVHKDKIIGEGFTSPYGGPHAEVNAVESVKNNSQLKEATLYVTLEPCSHFGKTPPCSDMIIEAGIPKVVIGIQDPHKKVAGQGIQKLRDAGCEITVGVLEEACRNHHKRFLSFQEKERPYVILKWAETQDGFIAPNADAREVDPKPFWITNRYSKQVVHQWRTEEQAILVGTNTALADNPKLTARNWEGKNPIRVVIDRHLKVPTDFQIFDDSAETLVFTETAQSADYGPNVILKQIDFTKPLAQQICAALYEASITSVLVEGGAKTLQSFISTGLWDEARIFVGQTLFGAGIKAPQISGTEVESKEIVTDTLAIHIND